MRLIVEFAVAHLAVLSVWAATVAILAGLGLAFRRLTTRALPGATDLYFIFWAGYAVALLILQLWHFVRPIDGRALALLALAGAAGLVGARTELAAWVRAEQPRRLTWSGAMTAFMLLWMANAALGPVSNFDGGAYHIPTIEWANAYRIVPGLGNLHGRLAFNSSSLLLGAALDVGPLHGRVYHVLAGVLLVPVLFHAFGALRRLSTPQPTDAAGDAFAATLVPLSLFTTIAHEPSSLDTDLPVGLVLLVCGELLLRRTRDAERDDSLTRWHFATLALLTAASVTLKLSAAVIGFALFAVSCWAFRGVIARWFRALLPALAVPVLLILSWMARGVVLSGYPMYPSSMLAMPVPWRVPAEQTASEADWVTFSARMLLQHDIPVDGNWFPFWLKGLGANPQDAAMLALPIMIALVAAFRMRRAGPSSATTAQRILPAWGLFLAPAIGLAFWFTVAPHPRFAVGSLWMVACLAVGLSHGSRARDDAERAERVSRMARRFAIGIGALVFVQAAFAPAKLFERIAWIGRSTMLGGLATRPGPDRGMHPMGSSRLLRYKTNSGLEVVVPASNNLCWDAPRCTPHPSPYLRLRTEGSVQDGFVADGGRWEPARWPDPLTPFFPYWRCLRRPHADGEDAIRACALAAVKVPTDTLKRVILSQGGDTVGVGPIGRAKRGAQGR